MPDFDASGQPFQELNACMLVRKNALAYAKSHQKPVLGLIHHIFLSYF